MKEIEDKFNGRFEVGLIAEATMSPKIKIIDTFDNQEYNFIITGMIELSQLKQNMTTFLENLIQTKRDSILKELGI